MPRVLVMSERMVTEMERATYLQTLAVRRERAAAASANFWVFEQLDQRGRFLEFVEAGAIDVLTLAIASMAAASKSELSAAVVWREAAAVY